MANPNKTVYNARRAVNVCIDLRTFSNRQDAEQYKASINADARITSFKLGPRKSPVTMYAVRTYQKR